MQLAKTVAQRVNVQRRVCKSVKCESYKVVTSYGADKLTTICKKLHDPGAYAITTLILNLKNPCIMEKDISQVTNELQLALPKYINLRKLAFYAPYAALDGSHLETLLNMGSPYTELELEMWTFHSPDKDMWSGRGLSLLYLEVNDGIAFPYAINNVLIGLKEHQAESLDKLVITNNTPHTVYIPYDILPYVEKTILNRIEYYYLNQK